MASFGERIRCERQRREITLADVSRETRISLQYLEALERNDFRELPGGVFNRGYVRAYARFIGADPETMVRAYLAEERARGVEDGTEDPERLRSSLAAAVKRRERQGSLPRKRRRLRILAIAKLFVLMTMLALAGWYYLEHPPRKGGRAHGTMATWSGEPGPAVVEPEPAAVEPPDERTAMADPAMTASREVLPSSPDEPVAADDPLHISVADFGVGSAVVDHELRGRSNRFEEGSVVWFWTRVLGGHPGEAVRHVWYHENDQVGMAILNVGGPHWRTQSRRPLEPGSVGRWSIEVRDAQDRLLVRDQFVCVPAETTGSPQG